MTVLLPFFTHHIQLVSDDNVTFQEWMAVNDLLDASPHLIHSTTIKFYVHGISEPFNP